jgi:hypothetical protein
VRGNSKFEGDVAIFVLVYPIILAFMFTLDNPQPSRANDAVAVTSYNCTARVSRTSHKMVESS